jgi:hypothetical protein
MTLAPLEALLLDASAAGSQDAPTAAHERLKAAGEQPVLTDQGFKPAREVDAAALAKVWETLRTTKAINLWRLALTEAA